METIQMINKLKKPLNVIPEERNVGKRERWISAAAGLLLGYIGIKNFRKGGAALIAPSGYLLYRGATGYCHVNALTGRNTVSGSKPFEFQKAIFIARKRSDVYNYWRNLENLPNIMKHVQKVKKINDQQYQWVAIFDGEKFKWNAQITQDIPNTKISWTSLESADVENSGSVEFDDAGENSTRLVVTIRYTPAQTELGKILAGFLNPLFKQIIKSDLREFKQKMESGEIPVDMPVVHA